MLLFAVVMCIASANGSCCSLSKLLACQVEVAKRERMLGNAEIEGLKKYHFNELHDLHDQLLAQRSAVVQLNMRLQQATQVKQPWVWGIHLCIKHHVNSLYLESLMSTERNA